MSKIIDNTNLGYLIGKIKSAFVAKADTQTVTGVDIDSAPTDNSNNLVTSGGVYDAINPPVQSSQPADGFEPNVVYDLGTLTGTVTFALASPTDANIVNHYYFMFDTGSTAPTITWPSGIVWPDDVTPTVDANKHYEVLVRNGYASILVFSLSA